MGATSGNKSRLPPTSALGGLRRAGNSQEESKVKNQNSSLLTPHSSLGYVGAINISKKKGEQKTNIGQGRLLTDLGLEGDAHAGDGKRQVSLLALESIRKMRKIGLEVGPGDFAENITTKGIGLTSLSIGARLKIGKEILVEVTQIGKVCHSRCAIYYQAGDCVMPKEGIFCQVLKGGPIKAGDVITVASAA